MPGSATKANSAAWVAALVAGAVIGQQVAAKATRDSLFLSIFPITDLPLAMSAAAAIAFVLVLLLGRLMTRHSPARVVPLVFAVNAALFAVERIAGASEPQIAAAALYLHTAGLGAVVVSGFWSVVTERFDPHTAKVSMGRIATGATVGGVVGGLAAWWIARVAPLTALLDVLALANLWCAVGIAWLGRTTLARPRTDDRPQSAISVLRATPYLRRLAVLVILGALSTAGIDYVFKATAAREFRTGAELVAFFSLFHAAAGIVTVVVQATLAKRLLENLGLAGTIATLPGTVIATGAFALGFPGVATAVLMRGSVSAVENSLFRSGYELLYTPLPRHKKRPTKTFIDVVCEKLAAAAGGGIIFVVVAALGSGAERILIAGAIAAAIVTIIVSRLVHRGYVTTLAESLRARAIDLDASVVRDITTRRTLADTMALDRRELMLRVAAMRDQGPGAAMSRSSAGDPIASASLALGSGDPDRVRKALRRASPLDPRLLPSALELLGDDRSLVDALVALREVASDQASALVRVLLDPGTPDVIRRRLPSVLRASPTQAATDGLVAALRDEHFAVRYRCGVALARITTRNPTLAVDTQAIFDATLREATLGERTFNSQDLSDPEMDDDSPFAEDQAARKLSRNLTHVFTLLSLVLDREPLQLAFRALGSNDQNVRGTGLEYLDTVLPAELLERLRPYLGERSVARRASRPRHQIVGDLMGSRDSLSLDVTGYGLRQPGGNAPQGPMKWEPSRPPTNDAARTVAGYRLEAQLNQSPGMGTYVAWDTKRSRRVVTKIVTTSSTAERNAAVQHARAHLAFTHPSVVEVFDVQTSPRGVVVAMAFAHGMSLRLWWTTARPWPELAAVFGQIGRGLAALHERGLTHGSFGPDAVLVDRSDHARVVISARPPPAAIDPQADQIAFCETLHEALYGVPVSQMQTIDAADAAAVPPRLAAAVRRGLDPDPRQRHASMNALVDVLETPERPIGVPDPQRTSGGWQDRLRRSDELP